MKFAIAYGNTMTFTRPDGLKRLARGAEAAGFESIWTVEHVIYPDGYESTYPYDPSGKMPAASDTPIPDPLVWLGQVAAVTTTLRLATGILILPQRNPLVLAKEVATLDALSGGRVELGVGVGWLEEEFDALGIPFSERGTRTDESIEVLRALWDGDHADYRGTHFSFSGVSSNPKPANGRVPIHIGGHSPVAARRADGSVTGSSRDAAAWVSSWTSSARPPPTPAATPRASRSRPDRWTSSGTTPGERLRNWRRRVSTGSSFPRSCSCATPRTHSPSSRPR
mgnify:CR=1 FL=1